MAFTFDSEKLIEPNPIKISLNVAPVAPNVYVFVTVGKILVLISIPVYLNPVIPVTEFPSKNKIAPVGPVKFNWPLDPVGPVKPVPPPLPPL